VYRIAPHLCIESIFLQNGLQINEMIPGFYGKSVDEEFPPI
jgi:hypothetical protein